MKQEKFKAINLIRELIIRIDNNLDNFPKKDIEIKNKIRNITYELLELVYEANSTSDNEYKMYLTDKSIAKIKVIDFLINLSYDKEIINHKRYIKFGEAMDEILKYLVGWKNSINRARLMVCKIPCCLVFLFGWLRVMLIATLAMRTLACAM